MGDAQVVIAVSKQEKVNQSLEKGKEGQCEGRLAEGYPCQPSPYRSQPDLGQRWSQRLTEQFLCKCFSPENSTEPASHSP